MAGGLLTQLPDPGQLLRQGEGLVGGLSAVGDAVTGLGSGAADSPLAGLSVLTNSVHGALDIDVTGLSERLPEVLRTLDASVPDTTLGYLRGLADDYTAAVAGLVDNALARALPAGGDLRTVVLDTVHDATELFAQRLTDFVGQLLGADELQQLRDTLAELDRLTTDLPANRQDLVPFLARHLVGLAPDAFDAVRADAQSVLATVSDLQPDALSGRLTVPLQACADAVTAFAHDVSSFDVNDAAQYQSLDQRLTEVQHTLQTAVNALATVYTDVGAAVDAVDWTDIANRFVQSLPSLSAEPAQTVDEVAQLLLTFLGDLHSGLSGVTSDQLSARAAPVLDAVRSALLGSGLGSIRSALADVLSDVSAVVEAIPTDEVVGAVRSMISGLGDTIHELGIDQVTAAIDAGLAAVRSAVDDAENVVAAARQELDDLLASVSQLPIDGLLNDLRDALGQVDRLLTELDDAVGARLDDLQGLLSRLDDVSFTPVSDGAIGEIDQLRAKLAAIDPSTLSDVERLALRGALAALQAIDLEGAVVRELRDGFHAGTGQLGHLLAQLTEAVQRFRQSVSGLDPRQLLAPVTSGLDQVRALLASLNADLLLQPLRDEVGALAAAADVLAPEHLLTPLAEPYAQATGVIRSLDPQAWLEPIQPLFAQLQQLVAALDFAPVLDGLASLEGQLAGHVRDAVLSIADRTDLPPPLDTLAAGIKPLLQAVADAVAGDPEVAVRGLGRAAVDTVHLSDLLTPLDAVFDRFIQLVDSLPDPDLTDAFDTLRTGLGTALDALDPGALAGQVHDGLTRLASIDPATELTAPWRLPELRAELDVTLRAAPAARATDAANLSAHASLVASLVVPGTATDLLDPLVAQYRDVLSTLGRQVAALDLAPATAAFLALRTDLDRVLPDFLRAPGPLTRQQVLDGLADLRPGRHAEQLDAAFGQVLDALVPLRDSVDSSIGAFVDILSDTLGLLDPRALEDELGSLTQQLQAKIAGLDPAPLADALRTDVLEPLTAPLDAVDPTRLAAQLQPVFEQARTAVTGTLNGAIDDVGATLDTVLQSIRQEVGRLLDAVGTTAGAAVDTAEKLLGRLDDLVFAQLLGRLDRVLGNLDTSFDTELDRVRASFDAMLAAIPGGGATSEQQVGA